MAHTNETFTFSDGRTINRLGFGTMRLTGQPGNFGPYEAWDAGIALLRRAASLGVEHFDTARAYGPHYSERLIADAFGSEVKNLFIATKGGIEKTGVGAEFIKRDGRPETLRRHLMESLQNLKVETIDLYYLHAPDNRVGMEDSVAELADAKSKGLIARIGLSNVSLAQLKTAEKVVQIDAVQNRYNPADGGDEAVLTYTAQKGIAFVPWGPLGANPMKQGAPLASGDAIGLQTPAQAALSELLSRAPNVLPIPGTTSRQHLMENMAAGRFIRDAA